MAQSPEHHAEEGWSNPRVPRKADATSKMEMDAKRFQPSQGSAAAPCMPKRLEDTGPRTERHLCSRELGRRGLQGFEGSGGAAAEGPPSFSPLQSPVGCREETSGAQRCLSETPAVGGVRSDLGVAHASRETLQRQRRASEDNGMTIAVGSPRAPPADVMLADARAERPGNEGWQFPCV